MYKPYKNNKIKIALKKNNPKNKELDNLWGRKGQAGIFGG